MPVARRYGTRQVETAPLPGVRRTAAETSESTGATAALQVGRARAMVHEAKAGLGAEGVRLGTALFEQARREASETRLIAAQRQLDDFELTRLHDPERGAFATAKGADALGILDPVTKDFDTLSGKIASGLQGRDKVQFEAIAERRREGMRASISQYTGRELAAWQGNERKSALESSQQAAVANADDPVRVSEELHRQRALIETWPGLGPETRAAATQGAVSATHEGVINNYLARGLDRRAQVYYEETRDQILGERQTAITQKLELATTAGAGQRAADGIWQRFAPKTDSDPIELDRMEDAARAQFGDDPKVRDTTIRYLRERKAGVDAARRERDEAIAGTLWQAAAQPNVSLDAVRRLPAFTQAPGRLQAQISDYIVQAAEHRASRAYAETRRVEGEKEQAGWALMWNYSRPDVLTQMSEPQILALIPDLGVDHVNRLMQQRRALASSDVKVREATIDQQLFETVADAAGLRPYQRDAPEDQRARLGQLRNAVESAVDVEQRARNRTLTREEKQTVMQRVVDRRVMIDRWGTDESLPAAVVNAKDRSNAYVPLEQISTPSLNEWVNVIRSQVPRELQATREDIVRRYRDRIQKAHAAAVLGLGIDEETRRLLGR
jgi:hypothetical protein